MDPLTLTFLVTRSNTEEDIKRNKKRLKKINKVLQNTPGVYNKVLGVDLAAVGHGW